MPRNVHWRSAIRSCDCLNMMPERIKLSFESRVLLRVSGN